MPCPVSLPPHDPSLLHFHVIPLIARSQRWLRFGARGIRVENGLDVAVERDAQKTLRILLGPLLHVRSLATLHPLKLTTGSMPLPRMVHHNNYSYPVAAGCPKSCATSGTRQEHARRVNEER